MFEPPRFKHDRMTAAIAAFDKFAAALGLKDEAAKIAPLVARYHAGIYRIVVVGEEKRGKSTFINALLATPGLLPAGSEPMTAGVFKIVYGPEIRCRVFFLPTDPDQPETSRRPPLDLAAEELRAYGTEAGNPNNAKGVDFIAIELPHPLLQAGVTIVDLPGLGGLKREHGLLTMRYLPNADAVFYVLDSVQSPFTREDVAALTRLRKHTAHVIFVQTKIDSVSSEQWQGWMRLNVAELAKQLDQDEEDIAATYFPVSSKLKQDFERDGDPEDLADSRFPKLVDHLHGELIPRILDRLAMPLVSAQLHAVSGVLPVIENEIAIASTTSQAELDRIEKALVEAQRSYTEWKNSDLPDILRQFDYAFGHAVNHARQQITADLDAGPYGPLVDPIMHSIEGATEMTAGQISAAAGDRCDAVIQAGSDRLTEISSVFDDDAQAAYAAAVEKIGESVGLVNITSSGTMNIGRSQRALSAPKSGWNTFQQVRSGVLSGAAIGAAAVGLAAVVFPPIGVAIAAVSALGAIFGGRRAYAEAQERQRDQALAKLRGFLADTARRLQGKALHEFGSASSRMHQDMRAELDTAVKKRDADGASNLAAIKQQRQQSREASLVRLKTLTEHKALGEDVLRLLQRAGAPTEDETCDAAA